MNYLPFCYIETKNDRYCNSCNAHIPPQIHAHVAVELLDVYPLQQSI